MLSLEYRFGAGREPVAAARSVAPPAPPPAVPEPVQRVPFRQKVNVGTQAQFALDKASLDAEARATLDALMEDLRDKEEIRIRVAGYACRLGAEDYNLALSERRAAAVGRYLEASELDAEIVVEGCGEANPIVSCEGLSGPALISCLAPNRRAEIEVSAIEIVMPDDPLPQVQP
jgi:OOP family OmpA-OmpF porin